jgi:NMD protein affecting ribosome stability and mRNA decay
MQVLSDTTDRLSDTKQAGDFYELKKKRREEIIKIIRANFNGSDPLNVGATITDIKTRLEGSSIYLGEKTLQRELVSMVQDKVLYKTGSKRWSRYFLPK